MTTTAGPRSAHPFHMWDGIRAIPDALRAEPAWLAEAEAAAGAMLTRPAVDLVGCGTSYFAAIAIAHVVNQVAGVPARAHNAFEYAAYPPPPSGRGTLVAISHTGTTPDVVAAVAAHGDAGPTLALTDAAGSPLAQACDHVLVEPGGLEPALTKTRSYATTLRRGYALALALARRLGRRASALERALDRAGEAAAAALAAAEADDSGAAARFASAPRVLVIGGGPELATANEAALKITEAASVHAVALQVEEAAHGAWASTRPGELAILLAPAGPTAAHADRVAHGMRTLGAHTWMLTNRAAPPAEVDALTRLPDLDEPLMPLVSVIPLQVFAYRLALARGLDPDTMGTDDPRRSQARTIMRRSLAARP
ncbi:SIS domain-containing protein [Pseudonocardia acaciae]|uniref:SIS domain-containing protein n=1 Tax=Pseudonocardia acaciae TaxID=551276 RepID=UPI00048AACB9|nr:SIS domain-containing protein [Pseudonocardia acaciae]